MYREATTEAEFIENLSSIIERERIILSGLHDLRFNESIGLEQFSPEQIGAYKSIVDRHDQLLKTLSSPRLNVSLEKIRDVTSRILCDYGYTENPNPSKNLLTPKDTVMTKLLSEWRAGLATVERLRGSGANTPDEIGVFGEASLAAVGKLFHKEPGISAERFFGCCQDAAALKQRLMEVFAQKWWEDGSQQRVRE